MKLLPHLTFCFYFFVIFFQFVFHQKIVMGKLTTCLPPIHWFSYQRHDVDYYLFYLMIWSKEAISCIKCSNYISVFKQFSIHCNRSALTAQRLSLSLINSTIIYRLYINATYWSMLFIEFYYSLFLKKTYVIIRFF